MNLDSVFKAYDIRGRTDNGELGPDLYRGVGAAMVSVLGFDRVAIGRDCRPTSLGFFEAMAEGITGAGADVDDLGEVPTDAVYFYSGARRVAGAVITASHNPANYNGLKLCRPGALPIGSESGLEDLKGSVAAGAAASVSDSPGIVRPVEVIDDFVDHLLGIVDSTSIPAMTVAVDGGNGMAGVVVPKVFDRLPAELTGLYLEPDGTFPNHPADPLDPANLVDLQHLMSEGRFDMGVAFDGDADRAFILDDLGSPLGGSTVTSLIARHLLEVNPGASVVHNLITSRAVPELVSEAGGVPLRTRVGHSFIKGVMAETGAVFGGEHSAHFYFRDNYGADSGMLAMLYLMKIAGAQDRPLSELRSEVERYVSSGEINFTVNDVRESMARVEGSVGDASVDHLDGLSVDMGDGWFNLRPSNTEPLLRLNVEAATKSRVDELVGLVRAIVEEA